MPKPTPTMATWMRLLAPRTFAEAPGSGHRPAFLNSGEAATTAAAAAVFLEEVPARKRGGRRMLLISINIIQ